MESAVATRCDDTLDIVRAVTTRRDDLPDVLSLVTTTSYDIPNVLSAVATTCDYLPDVLNPVTTTCDDLPDSILIEIFSNLSQKELLSLQLVSKRWQTLAKDRYLWRYCDFSYQTERFLRKMASSSIIQQPQALRIVQTAIPIQFLASVFANKSLRALCLRQSRLMNSICSSAEGNENCELENDRRQGRTSSEFMRTGLKYIDARETIGETKMLMECLFHKSNDLEALGLPNRTPPIIQRKLASCMPFLRILDCSECNWFCDRIMLHLSRSCPLLEYLSVRRCINIYGAHLSQFFAGCKRLKSLDLQRTRLTDEVVLQADWSKAALEEIDLSHCYALDDAGLKWILSNLRSIRYLRAAVTDPVMESMVSCVSQLEVFEIRRRYPVRTGLIATLLRNCPNMVALDTSLIPIDAKHFRQFLPNMPKLKRILFAAHEALGTFDVLQQLLNHCREVEYVGVNCYHSNADKFMRHGLLTLASRSKKLKVIALQGFLVDKLLEKLKLSTEGNPLYNNVTFECPMQIDVPNMEHGLDSNFRKYVDKKTQKITQSTRIHATNNTS